jgi:predicted HTH domain antitoxin
MAVTIQLPNDVEQRLRSEVPNLDGEATEALLLDLFRRGKLSHFELSKILGLDRFQTDALLKRHNIFEGSPTSQDLDEQQKTMERVLGRIDR